METLEKQFERKKRVMGYLVILFVLLVSTTMLGMMVFMDKLLEKDLSTIFYFLPTLIAAFVLPLFFMKRIWRCPRCETELGGDWFVQMRQGRRACYGCGAILRPKVPLLQIPCRHENQTHKHCGLCGDRLER